MNYRGFLVIFLLFCVLVSAIGKSVAKKADDYIEGVVLRGESARSILTQYMTNEDFHKMYAATRKVYDLSLIREDYNYEIINNEEDGLKVFSYQFNKEKKVVIRINKGKYTAEIKSADYDIIPKGAVLKATDSDVVAEVELAKTSMPSSENKAKKKAESVQTSAAPEKPVITTDLQTKNKKFINLAARGNDNATEQSPRAKRVEERARAMGERAVLQEKLAKQKAEQAAKAERPKPSKPAVAAKPEPAKTEPVAQREDHADTGTVAADRAENTKTPPVATVADSDDSAKDAADSENPADDEPVDDIVRVEDNVKKGEFALAIFSRCMEPAEFNTVFAQTKKTYNLNNLSVGNHYTLAYTEHDGFVSFDYEIDAAKTLHITKNKTTGKFEAKIDTQPQRVVLSLVKGTITSSLFKSIVERGERAELAVLMADIFKSEINFIRDIRKGDSFAIAVEKVYIGERFLRYGRIIGVRFVNRGVKYEGIRFPDAKGWEQYYNAKGESLTKSMLKMPLKFTRISSHYTMGRKHPIFKDVRKHQGVDYAAPEGTPVNSVSNGKVKKVGWANGYGKMIVVEHAGGLESQYAHLSRYAKKLKVGQYVKQGQVIGYVGQTGWATGPHLDFRLRRNGKFINPERVVTTRSNPIPKKSMKKFNEQRNFVQRVFDGKFKRSQYKPGMVHLSAK